VQFQTGNRLALTGSELPMDMLLNDQIKKSQSFNS
jgi:hypothetical protein